MLTVIDSANIEKLNTDDTYVLVGRTNIFGDCASMRYFGSYSNIMKFLTEGYKSVKWYVTDDELKFDGITTFNKVDMFTIRRVTDTSRIRSKISRENLEKITEKLGQTILGN